MRIGYVKTVRTSQPRIAGQMLGAVAILGGKGTGMDVTPELAYVVEVEQLQAKVYGGEDITPYALRVTMIFRPEDGTWKVVHRHADPITTAQPDESVIQG